MFSFSPPPRRDQNWFLHRLLLRFINRERFHTGNFLSIVGC